MQNLTWPLSWRENPVLCVLAVLFMLGWLSYATFCVGSIGYAMIASLPVMYALLDGWMCRRTSPKKFECGGCGASRDSRTLLRGFCCPNCGYPRPPHESV
jgi:hypothetical protein